VAETSRRLSVPAGGQEKGAETLRQAQKWSHYDEKIGYPKQNSDSFGGVTCRHRNAGMGEVG
jgi:hypothetical protein